MDGRSRGRRGGSNPRIMIVHLVRCKSGDNEVDSCRWRNRVMFSALRVC
jgi:hypothetical protein